MDRALYVGMSGATQTMLAQAVNSHNLANASTLGFKAQLVEAQAVVVQGNSLQTRVNVRSSDGGWDSSSGTLQQTNRDLDVAFADKDWLAVQTADGSEAYTRRGDLQIDNLGRLLTGSGEAVMGEGGPLSVPPASSVSIASDGTISIVPQGQSAAAQAVVGRLKVVTAEPSQLLRGADGLMRASAGVQLSSAAGSVVTSGALESSNVNLAESMVNMISLARQFELQTKLMKSADENAQASSSIMKMGG
ncbi:MAG: Flagellar basal-body rod protein FlgF [Hydrocarboniphaga sp.]|uniref:flagellar basal body rod protein FlgF n=1 Tax=Hydrocarboniphaga sp. TaxID=2033016 RepID=UPI0026075A03|nr:flagellar basal body rod protein FlgF [Hydrocarboniphaga sp.]MDB5967593.1 Flagellar basal-body rod protein FlgF [Hydrocarboniphaga sp.]